MKKLVLVLLFPLFLSSAGHGDSQIVKENVGAKKVENVFICTGGSSKKYHRTKTCHGLNNCGGEIKQVSLEYAKDLGRTPCKICIK